MEQGTGKTHVTLATLVHLFKNDQIGGMLVLAPNGVHLNWAKNEIPLHVPDTVREQMSVMVWKSNMGIRDRAIFDWTVRSDKPLITVLANIEAVRTEGFIKAIQPLFTRKLLMVVDEATIIKNPKAIQTKRTLALARHANFTRILTGTPITQGPLDLWAQCRFLSETALPYPSYTAFKAEFAIEKEMILGPRHFRKIIGYRNLDRLSDLIKPFTYRVMKKDCLDLPPKIYQKRYVELTDEQRRVYKEIAKECMSIVNDQMVTTTTVLTAMLRLHQVALGYVTDDNRVMQPIPSNRIRGLLELYEELQGKAVVFCRFKEDCRQVSEALGAVGRIPAIYNGDVEDDARHNHVTAFQEGDVTDLICTRAASRGLTLHAASNVIYYSQGFSLEDRLQSEDRAHRIGQQKSVLYTDLIAEGTIDEKIIEILLNKQAVADLVMNREVLTSLLAPISDL